MTTLSSFQCRHCSEKNLLPIAPLPVDSTKLVEQTIKKVLDELLSGARDPARIGRRVLLLDHALRSENEVKKLSQRALAEQLGVSEPRISVALSTYNSVLVRLRQC